MINLFDYYYKEVKLFYYVLFVICFCCSVLWRCEWWVLLFCFACLAGQVVNVWCLCLLFFCLFCDIANGECFLLFFCFFEFASDGCLMFVCYFLLLSFWWYDELWMVGLQFCFFDMMFCLSFLLRFVSVLFLLFFFLSTIWLDTFHHLKCRRDAVVVIITQTVGVF